MYGFSLWGVHHIMILYVVNPLHDDWEDYKNIVVVKAIKRNPNAFQYLCDTLTNDREFVLEIIKQCGTNAYQFLQYQSRVVAAPLAGIQENAQ